MTSEDFDGRRIVPAVPGSGPRHVCVGSRIVTVATVPPYDPDVTPEPVDESAREVRRIVVAALLAVLVAAPIATVLVLRGADDGGTPAADAELFPSSFREPGFVAETVSLGDSATVAAGTAQLRHEFEGTATAWIIARCDAGSITVQVGSVSSSRQCTGRSVGLVAVGAETGAGPSLDVVATVSRPQRSAWGVAVYR